MRKPLLFVAALALAGSLQAQTETFFDDFEGYVNGDLIGLISDDWSTWTGVTSEDAPVSNAYAFSGTNSLEIENDGANPADIVLPLGDLTSGKHDISWKMYIPNGQGGYFNLLHDWGLDGSYEWAIDVFFSSTGDITWTAGGVDGGGETFTPDSWFDVKVAADLDNDMGYLYFDGVLVLEWQWSLNNANGGAGLNQLSAVDFFGTEPTGSGTALYYVDDVKVEDSTGLSVEESTQAEALSFFPNPADDNVQLSWSGNTAFLNVEIVNLTGQIVRQVRLTSGENQTINVSDLPAGVYLARSTENGLRQTQRLVIR